MKLGKSFYVIMAILVGFIVLFELKSPVKFNWYDSSFSHNSKQPFGCYVFDSIMDASLPGGYEVIGQSLDELATNCNHAPINYLIVDEDADLDSASVQAIKTLLLAGNHVMIVGSNIGNIGNTESAESIWSHLLGAKTSSEYFSARSFVLDAEAKLDTVVYLPSKTYTKQTYITRGELINSRLHVSNDYRVIARYRYSDENYDYELDQYSTKYLWENFAAVRSYGKGQLLLCVAPRYFCNYGILNDDIRPLVMRLMNEIDGKRHWVRIDTSLKVYTAEEQTNENSIFRYLLSKPPLRWALYLSLVTLLLFVFFTARRRQRVIPVVKPPQNLSMSMIKHIGTLYYLRHDNVDLLRKKWTYFVEQVRRQTGVDVEDEDHQAEELQTLAQITGLKANELKRQIQDVIQATNRVKLPNDKLKELIKTLNDILSNI